MPYARRSPLSPPSTPSAMVAAACLALPGVALMGTASAETADLGDLEVVGLRPSIASARQIKQEAPTLTDAIVAEAIARLPDLSVGESLSRVPGVQIARDRGEAGVITVRGLTQIETTMDGREIFTAGSGRTLEFSDIPAELVAAIEVHKSAAADRLEGGIGGSIDLRTRRAFDFAGPELALSVGALHGDLADDTGTRGSLLAANRWKGAAGEFGALLSLSYQDRPWREDQKSTGAPQARTDLIPGQTLIAPNGASETASLGTRERKAGQLALQWRPAAGWELYTDLSYAELDTRQDSYQINAATGGAGFVPGSLRLFPGTNAVEQITWSNVPLSILSFARDTLDRTSQAAVGGRWTGDSLALSADLSHTESQNSLRFTGPWLKATAATLNQRLGGDAPDTTLGGADLLDPANLAYTGIAYRYRPFAGDLDALRLDGEWFLDAGWVESLAAGVRLARRRADDAPGLVFADAAVSAPATQGGLLVAGSQGGYFPGSASLAPYLAGAPRAGWDGEALRAQFGLTAPIPAGGNPLGVWAIEEETRAAYLLARLARPEWGLDGNLGLRAVTTLEGLDGSQSEPSSGAIRPIAIDHEYTDWLPSLNLRLQLAEGLQLRGAASRTLTRPNFDQLSPSLTLVPNPISPSLNQGSAGNPELEPVYADNLDLALEWYPAEKTALYGTLFGKRVEGFVVSRSQSEWHDGAWYQISRPDNGNDGEIRGLELGAQTFFAGLPGWLDGLGVQASYTFVESETHDALLGRDVPLQGLSRHSANLIGLYDHGDWSARVAYNWRDDYLSGVTNIVGVGTLPIYTEGYGWLDALLTWQANDDLAVSLTGSNLLDTVRRSYYGDETHPQSAWRNDVQVGLLVTARLR